jgi:hypothetical protein
LSSVPHCCPAATARKPNQLSSQLHSAVNATIIRCIDTSASSHDSEKDSSFPCSCFCYNYALVSGLKWEMLPQCAAYSFILLHCLLRFCATSVSRHACQYVSHLLQYSADTTLGNFSDEVGNFTNHCASCPLISKATCPRADAGAFGYERPSVAVTFAGTTLWYHMRVSVRRENTERKEMSTCAL